MQDRSNAMSRRAEFPDKGRPQEPASARDQNSHVSEVRLLAAWPGHDRLFGQRIPTGSREQLAV